MKMEITQNIQPSPDIAKIAADIAASVAAQAIEAAKVVAQTAAATASTTAATVAATGDNKSDHDLLIAVHEKVKALTDSVDKLNDNMDARLSRVETTKLAASDFVSFRNEQVNLNDKVDTRIKILETFRSVLMGAFIISNIIIVPVLIWLVISALSKHS